MAGPPAATAQLEKQLTRHGTAFEIHRYADGTAVRNAVESRTVYGAVVVTAGRTELLTASAGSPLVAQLLQQAVAERAAASGARVQTVDVVPAPAADPRGSALGASVLPLALAGIAAGALVSLSGLRGIRAVSGLVGAAALVGLAAAAPAHGWLGVLTGDWWAEAAVLGLSTPAVSAAVAGCAALLGTPGIGAVSFVVMFLGNPFSGAASAPRMPPEPVGAIGQWLPPGAGTTLLRSVSFFDGAAATGPALTLVRWAALGLGAVLLGARPKGDRPRPSRPARPDGPRSSPDSRLSALARDPTPHHRAVHPGSGTARPFACRCSGPAPPPPAPPPPHALHGAQACPLGRIRPPVLRRDPEPVLFAGSGRDLAHGGDRTDHRLLRGLVEFVEPLQVDGGDEGDERLAVAGHDDTFTAVHHAVDQVGEFSPGLRHRNLVGHDPILT
ncbi:hypothetical protein J2X68_006197 [Streptomyces sp. 3330]|nr:hypothetical protein [Streptomyces sp. 3330]